MAEAVTQSFDREGQINHFAIRSFRDMGDQDYISARMAYRAGLSYPSLWQSQQTIEKYLKCILLLNRIPAATVRHSLQKAMELINASMDLDLAPVSLDFISHIDEVGEFRYLEVSTTASGLDLIRLDRLVWELRRFCTLDTAARSVKLPAELPVPKYQLLGGLLEEIECSPKSLANEPLVWNNLFFGEAEIGSGGMRTWMKFDNAPLYMHPEILDDLLLYVYLPKNLVRAWKQHKTPGYAVKP